MLSLSLDLSPLQEDSTWPTERKLDSRAVEYSPGLIHNLFDSVYLSVFHVCIFVFLRAWFPRRCKYLISEEEMETLLQIVSKCTPHNFCHLLCFMGICIAIILECLEICLKFMKVWNSLLNLIAQGRFPTLPTYTGIVTAEDILDPSFLSIHRRQQSNKRHKLLHMNIWKRDSIHLFILLWAG